MFSRHSCLRLMSVRTRPRLLVSSRNRAFATKKEMPETSFGQKAQARAEQMHNEIESIVKKHDQVRQQEAEKMTKFSGFVDFLKKNKTNLSIIVVSFLTVVLSAKLVQNKQKYLEVEKELQKTQSELVEKRKLLKSITSEAFLSKVAENCSAELLNGSKKGWGRGSTGKNSSAKEAIMEVLSKDLSSLVRDAALTEDEIHARELEELRAKGKDSEEAAIEKLSALSHSSEQEEAIEEWVENADGKKIVKKSVFRI